MKKLSEEYIAKLADLFSAAEKLHGKYKAMRVVMELHRRPGPVILHRTEDMDRVIFQSAKEYNVTVDDVLGRSRFHRCVSARQKAMVEMAKLKYSPREIAEALNRERTTVLAALRKSPV